MRNRTLPPCSVNASLVFPIGHRRQNTRDKRGLQGRGVYTGKYELDRKERLQKDLA